MSSTNRGGKRSPADSYPSPSWTVHRLLEKIQLPGGNWFEPGGGGGHIIRAVNEMRSDVTWWSIDIQENCRAPLEVAVGSSERVEIADFLDSSLPLFPGAPRFDVAIGNPPFSLAFSFVQRSLQLADTVAFLLRLNFLGSETRHEWMKTYPPDIYTLPNRPGFSPEGTDSIEYAWFVWEGLKERVFGLHRVLDLTPLEERRRIRERDNPCP